MYLDLRAITRCEAARLGDDRHLLKKFSSAAPSTMIVHEPIDNVRSTNQLFYYSSPKTSEDAHEFIMALQKILLDELENSEKNSGPTLYSLW